MKKITSSVIGLVILTLSATAYADDTIRSLQNLERERARLINIALSPEIDNLQRQKNIQTMSFNLVDLERMVLRDDRLLGLSHPAVKRAFKNYDLTFISHASMEADQHIVIFWLEQQGLSSENILNGRIGLR